MTRECSQRAARSDSLTRETLPMPIARWVTITRRNRDPGQWPARSGSIGVRQPSVTHRPKHRIRRNGVMSIPELTQYAGNLPQIMPLYCR